MPTKAALAEPTQLPTFSNPAQRATMVARFVAALLACAFLPLFDASAQARTLSFEERVTAQRAIEQVYWSHRIWPAQNPGAKPSLSAVMPEAAIRAKVEDYLEKSNALE